MVLDAGGGGGGGSDVDVDEWVPGKPPELTDIARDLTAFGTQATTIATELSAVVAALAATSWNGDMATTYQARLAALPERLTALGDAYELAGTRGDTLADRARDLRRDARTAIDRLVDARAAESAATAAYDAAADRLRDEGILTGGLDAIIAMGQAQGDVDDAQDDINAALDDLRVIAKEYHDACSECATGVDAAEPDALLDRDFMSIVIEARTDAQLAGLLANWNTPFTSDLDDPDLDGAGEYEDRTGDPLFPNGMPRPEDVNQGDLGNCWLLAVLAGMAAQNPDALKQMIRQNADGTYTVTFADGERVTVDAQVRDSGGHALWVSIIEKAYAKREGGYAELDGGDPNDAIDDLIGGGTNSFDPDSTRDLFFGDNVSPGDAYDRIDDALDDGRVVTASVRDSLGIDGGHALTVTDVYSAGGEEYVVVRNPWGSHGQMEDAIRDAGGTIRSNGYFVMPIGAFADHFYKVRMQK